MILLNQRIKKKYFYKNEFKNLFLIKLNIKNIFKSKLTKDLNPLIEKQIISFISTYLNQHNIRNELYLIFKNANLLNSEQINF